VNYHVCVIPVTRSAFVPFLLIKSAFHEIERMNKDDSTEDDFACLGV
jgi:hypothetical protein